MCVCWKAAFFFFTYSVLSIISFIKQLNIKFKFVINHTKRRKVRSVKKKETTKKVNLQVWTCLAVGKTNLCNVFNYSLFVCYASLGISPFYYLLTRKKCLHRVYTLFIQHLHSNQILFINSSTSTFKSNSVH